MTENLRKYILRALLCVIPSLILAACSGEDPRPKEDEPELVDRTVLVYMVADNSLGAYYFEDQADFNEMLVAAQLGDGFNGGRLLVYYNRPGTVNGNVPELIEVTPDGNVTLKSYPDDTSVYSVDQARMREVLDDVQALAPAAEYGLVLWSHASSWLTSANDRKYSFGEDRGKNMSLTSLAEVLGERHFCFIYFDCCLMGNIECFYQLRGCTDYLIASPTELHLDGMRYDLTLPYFFKAPQADVVGAAKEMYEFYDGRTGNDRQFQTVVVDARALDALAEVSRRAYKVVSPTTESVADIQKYTSDAVCHSRDMHQFFNTHIADPQFLEEWNKAFADAVLYRASTPRGIDGLTITYYEGLGIYITTSIEMAGYRGYYTTAWWLDVASAQYEE